jgi:rhodanese-related sulfurtransferase
MMLPSKEDPACWTVQRLEQNRSLVRIIDVRNWEDFDRAHIRGAQWCPLDSLEEVSRSWSADQVVVAACGKGGGRSETAATFLRNRGFEAYSLCGGTQEWLNGQRTPEEA